MENIKIIGTTHLDTNVEEIIRKEEPDVIGVEFCQTRVNIFVNGQTQQVQEEPTTLLGKISHAIKKKAEEEKVVYGLDMITASKYAIDNKIPLVLLDRPIEEVNNLMQKIPEKEQIGFMKELADFQTKSLKENTKEIDENEVIRNLKLNYPVAYEFLIASREQYIIIQILKAILKYPNKKILIFLGKGHVNSIENQINIGGKFKIWELKKQKKKQLDSPWIK